MKKKIFIAIGILVLIGIILFFVFWKPHTGSGNVVKEGSAEYSNLKENCECVERNNLYCSLEGFKVDEKRRLCVNPDGRVTFVVLGCSKYDCDGTIYEVKK